MVILAGRTAAQGYYFLALVTSLMMAAVLGLIVVLHHQENTFRPRRSVAKGLLLLAVALALAITGGVLRLDQSLPAILGTLRPIALGRHVGFPLREGSCHSRPCFGYHDHDGTLRQQAVPSDIGHHFIPWGDRHLDRLRAALEADRARGIQSLITLEPWPWALLELGDPTTYAERERQANRSLLAEISAGRHDRDLLVSLRQIAEAGRDHPVLVRLMHEMEITGQYPWSPADPKAFIAAYRHTVALSRRHNLSGIRWVWSPAGAEKAAAFWPGGDMVDFVGVSIYATPEWNGGLVPEGHNLSLDRLLKSKYWVRRYGKPILLTEVGINGPADEKRAWFREAITALPYFPEVVGWVYFNQRQPPIVQLPFGLPNWGLSPQEAADLRKALEQSKP